MKKDTLIIGLINFIYICFNGGLKGLIEASNDNNTILFIIGLSAFIFSIFLQVLIFRFFRGLYRLIFSKKE